MTEGRPREAERPAEGNNGKKCRLFATWTKFFFLSLASLLQRHYSCSASRTRTSRRGRNQGLNAR